jgi:hypothetical protein
MPTIRDRLWLFGMPIEDARRRRKWLPEGHLMTTLEATAYLRIPNALWVVQKNFPEPPFDTYIRPLTPLSRVVLSALGDSSSDRSDLDEVLRMADMFPNISGAILDDFFRKPNQDTPVGRFTLDELDRFRERLHSAVRKLDLWVVIYGHQLDLPAEDYLARCDVVTFWNWWGRDIPKLDDQFDRLDQLAPDTRKMLGCYFMDPGDMEDGGDGKLSLDLMKHQCGTGLKWLEEGRIEGIILLGNPVCGFGGDTVEWTRDWIAEIGEQPF